MLHGPAEFRPDTATALKSARVLDCVMHFAGTAPNPNAQPMKTVLHRLVLLLIVSAMPVAANAHSEQSFKALMDYYAPIRDALVKDDFKEAKANAEMLSVYAKANDKNVAAKARSLANANSIESLRQTFEQVSKYVLGHLKDKPGYYVVNCPVAQAVWIQTDQTIQNPYLGKKGLSCGTFAKQR